ncbi:MAG TPA: hypothetical protein VGV09_06455 [Steroidobacteraceae bacterium]|nr:hypothetical protein [Steroidobacteraceae bacterium]
MQRFAAILLISCGFARSYAGALSGIHMPPYPQGLVERGGSCIQLNERAAARCAYGFGVLADAAGNPKIIYAGRLEGRDESGKAKWLVLDSFRIPKLPGGYRMAVSECAENGTVDETIVAAVRSDGSKMWLDEVLFAKRFNVPKGEFSDLSVKHIRCKNIGMG